MSVKTTKESKSRAIRFCIQRAAGLQNYDDEITTIHYYLSKKEFAGVSLSVPRNVDEYLIQLYGEDYMCFPYSGIKHHGDERGSLSEWALHSGQDMERIIGELNEILKELEKLD